MTVIFGALSPAGALRTEDLHNQLDRMGRRAAALSVPSSAVATHSGLTADDVAFGACEQRRPGTPAAAPFARSERVWLAFEGRLDNRAELARRLDLTDAGTAPAANPQRPPLTDAELVLAAHARFGPDCTEHLLGDWVLAIWDAARQQLLLARDATGSSAFYWWQGGGTLLFATALPTLLAAGPVPTRPDARWLGGLLTVFTDPARPGATAYEGVHAVPPGHRLVVAGQRVTLERWWRPEDAPPLTPGSPGELQDRFLALYDDAVRSCLRRRDGSVAITLSGGLDSGSVAALAAPALAEEGGRLTGFVHIPRFAEPQAGRTTDEWPLAQATAHFVGHIDAVACPTDHISPVEGIRRWLDMAAVPSHAASNWYWLLDLAQHASSAGASVLLTGQAGNSTVSHEGNGDIRPLLHRAGLAAAWRELRAEEAGWLAAVRDRIVKPVLRPGWHACQRAGAAAASRDPGWFEFCLLRSSLADRLDLDAAMRRAGHYPRLSPILPHRLQQFRLSLMDGADNGLAAWSALGIAHNLSIRDPTRDRRLVEFCWQLPDEVFWAHGRRRGLVRNALRHGLPREVLACTRKGLQSSDLRRRLHDCRDDFLGRVDEACRHPVAREWIDTDRLAVSARAAVAIDSPLPGGSVVAVHVLRALAAAMFVIRHS